MSDFRPPPKPPARRDPQLTVLPPISAPVDEGILIPAPPRSLWDRLFWMLVIVGLAAALLAYVFFHANPMR